MNSIVETDEQYHAKAKAGEYMSSHMLRKFAESPYYYHKLVTGAITEPDTPAMAFGRASHCLILEGKEAFNSRYTVSDGPINAKTGDAYGKSTKAYAEWKASITGEIISNADYNLMRSMFEGVEMNAEATNLINGAVGYEEIIRGEILGVNCQARLDAIGGNYIVDLKTCDTLKWFESDVKRYGYVYQLAFYRELVNECHGSRPDCYLIAVEKSGAHNCGVWRITYDALDQAARINVSHLLKFAECQRRNIWDTGYEETRLIAEV